MIASVAQYRQRLEAMKYFFKGWKQWNTVQWKALEGSTHAMLWHHRKHWSQYNLIRQKLSRTSRPHSPAALSWHHLSSSAHQRSPIRMAQAWYGILGLQCILALFLRCSWTMQMVLLYKCYIWLQCCILRWVQHRTGTVIFGWHGVLGLQWCHLAVHVHVHPKH